MNSLRESPQSRTVSPTSTPRHFQSGCWSAVAALSLLFSQQLVQAADASPPDTQDEIRAVPTPEKLPSALTVASPELNVRTAPFGEVVFQLYRGMEIKPIFFSL